MVGSENLVERRKTRDESTSIWRIMSNKNFTLKELNCSSSHTELVPESLPVSVADNLMNLWYFVLQPLRDAYGGPIIVSSGYRSEALNKAVSGVKNSQHLLGQAADVCVKRKVVQMVQGVQKVQNVTDLAETMRLGKLIEELGLLFDQLIYEPTWIHVSYGPRHRRQVLHN